MQKFQVLKLFYQLNSYNKELKNLNQTNIGAVFVFQQQHFLPCTPVLVFQGTSQVCSLKLVGELATAVL